MSQENVEVVRLAQEPWGRGDSEAVIDSLAKDAEVETDPRFIEGGTFCGVEAIRRWFEDIRDGWKHGGPVVTKEHIDLGDCVLSVDEWRGTGEISGVEASIPVTGVWTLEAGKITRIRFYFDHQDALEAVGLRE